MINKFMELYKKYKEIIMYLFFGVTTTIVNWVIYICLIKVGSMTVVANMIAWLGAVSYAFITNKLFVFESKSMSPDVVLKEGISFFMARMFSGVFEIIGPEVLMSAGMHQQLFGIKGFVAKIVISVLVIIMNYVLSKLLVFRNKKEMEYATTK